MIAQNTSEQMLAYRLSRRSLLAGLAGFTSLSALLAACGTASGNLVGATATPTIGSASPTSSALSPTPSRAPGQSPTSTPTPAQSPTTIPASGPVGATLFEYHGHPLPSRGRRMAR